MATGKKKSGITKAAEAARAKGKKWVPFVSQDLNRLIDRAKRKAKPRPSAPKPRPKPKAKSTAGGRARTRLQTPRGLRPTYRKKNPGR